MIGRGFEAELRLGGGNQREICLIWGNWIGEDFCIFGIRGGGGGVKGV